MFLNRIDVACVDRTLPARESFRSCRWLRPSGRAARKPWARNSSARQSFSWVCAGLSPSTGFG